MKECSECGKQLDPKEVVGVSLYTNTSEGEEYDIYDEENGFCSSQCALRSLLKRWEE